MSADCRVGPLLRALRDDGSQGQGCGPAAASTVRRDRNRDACRATPVFPREEHGRGCSPGLRPNRRSRTRREGSCVIRVRGQNPRRSALDTSEMARFVADLDPAPPVPRDAHSDRILRAERRLTRSSQVLRSAEDVLSRAEARLERSRVAQSRRAALPVPVCGCADAGPALTGRGEAAPPIATGTKRRQLD